MNTFLSIIIPIYNSEKYLCRCIDSLLNQTFQDFELLLINDGSQDNSAAICNKYAQLDNRIRVFHKTNGGVASARQVGLVEARGEYSIHVDSDDWVERNMLEDLYYCARATNADIVIADFYNDFGNGRIENQNQFCDGYSSTEIAQMIISDRLMGSLCNKLVRHKLYADYGLEFVPGVNYQEDALMMARLMCHELKVSYLKKAYYHYCMENIDSITRNYTETTFKNRQQFWITAKKMLPTELFSEALDQSAFNIKMEAIRYNQLTFRTFNNQLPTSINIIQKSRLSWKDKIVLSCCCLLNNIGL